MLSYAFSCLKQNDYKNIAAEQFENVEDLFAAILAKGTAFQIKHGLHREYISMKDTLSVLRGKLNMPETVRNRVAQKQKLACEFDELSEDNVFNQILKTTLFYLLRSKDVKRERKIALRTVIVFFDNVKMLDPSSIMWERITYQKSNKNYEMLINLCYFVFGGGMLQTTSSGDYKMGLFSDENMAKLYEKFILEYYNYHYGCNLRAKAAQVKWDVSDDEEKSVLAFLPTMQTDITLKHNEKTLIIDAKYYGHTLQKRFDKASLHSGNIYQIFTYVKNLDKDNTGNVSGLLLYAKTQEEITPDCRIVIGGNSIGAKTLDLNTNFKVIASQLDKIIDEYFGNAILLKVA